LKTALLLAAAMFANAGPASAEGNKSPAKQLSSAAGPVQASPASPAGTKETPVNPRYWAVVSAKSSQERTRIFNLGMDIVEAGKDSSAGIANEGTLSKIKEAGFEIISSIPLEKFSASFTKDFPPSDLKYHNFDRMQSDLKAYAEKLKGYSSIFSIGKSVQGREILCLRLNSSVSGDKPSGKPGALFIGNHHAREHLSVEMPLKYAAWLAENKDGEAKAVLEGRDIYIVPMLNPDGAEYDIDKGQYRWWRKNRAKTGGDAFGVDLNRNYAARWGQGGSSSNPGSDTYMGTAAFSEPETQAVRDFFGKHSNVAVAIAYHSYSRLVLYPLGSTDDDVSDGKDLKIFKAIAGKLAGFTGYKAMKSSELYVATGDMCDWAYEKHHVFAFTIELDPERYNYGGFYPGPGMIDQSAAGNVKAMLYMSQIADNPSQAEKAGR